MKVILDLPYVAEKGGLRLRATEMSLSIEAKTKRPVSVLVGGPYQRKVKFEKYAITIRLPVAINPTSGSARFRNGIVVVTFELCDRSHFVKIE